MSGGPPLSNTDGSLIQIHGRIMNTPPPLADGNSNPRITTENMPVSAAVTTFGQVLRMPTLQDFHGLPSLALSSYGNIEATQGSYFYQDNDYGVSTLPCIKEEKPDDRSHTPVESKSSPGNVHSSTASPKNSSDSYIEKDDMCESKPKLNMESRSVDGSAAVIRSGLVSSNYHPRHSSDKIMNSATRNLMSVRTPLLLNNHQPIIRYPPNGDALLSATAVSYSDNEILPDSGFNVAVGNPLGSLLGMGTAGSGGDGGAFDLFDGEGRAEPYNQDVQLSPSAFSNSAEPYGLNENSNQEQMMEDNGGNEDMSILKSGEDETKQNVSNSNVAVVKTKNKCKPAKSGSPNRTGNLPCPVCMKIFSNSSALAKHKLTHSDERKYVCQLCTKAFKRQDHLNGHLLTHMNKKPYECKVEGCGKSYCDARSLRRHTENHHAAMAQASAAAAVNAIAIRMGTSSSDSESNNNSFLAAALQSNRIRYAPPPAAVATTTPASSVVTTTSPNDGSGVTSAATQLQLLAFQQSAATSQETSSAGPSTASTWHQQQNVLFINSSLGRVAYGGVGENQAPCIKEEKEHSESSGVGIAVQAESGGERIQSVLERHLKIGITAPKDMQGGGENLSSTITSNEILSRNQAPILQGLHALSSPSQALPMMAFQLKNQWPQPSSFSASFDFGSDPKPVECNICQRRFKNIPALNGHMRLHGGYLKRDTDNIKKGQDKKLDSSSSLCSTSSGTTHLPLQTASINVRALIEEKIIQKRIINPTINPLNSTLPPPPPPLFLTPPLPSPLNSIHSSIDHPPPIEHHQGLSSNYISLPEMMSNDNVDEELLSYESSDQQPVLPSSLPPPPLPPGQSTRSNLMRGGSSMEEDAQTSMQRQIEIIKQGLMSHHPIIEKFRRHSDSDHFLAPDRSSYLELCDSSSSASFMAYMRQRIVCKRTQRTGSDPGEFAVNTQLNDDMFSGDLEIDDLGAEEDDVSGTIPSSDMMDFEIVGNSGDQHTKNSNTTSLLAAALCSTPPSTLMDVIEGISSPFNENLVMSEATQALQTEGSFKNLDVTEDDDVFLSPSSIPSSPSIIKKKHRPEPLHIPPQVNTCGYQSRLRSPRLWDPTLVGKIMSPPPYTPPPMLSPVRSGPGLFWHVLSGSGSLTPKSAPITPGRFTNVVDVVMPVAVEETTDSFSEPPETDIQPHVNIGRNFQAQLPQLRSDKRHYDPYVADLVWDPKTEEIISEKELDMYLQFACCAAIPGGGRNKEYALHILHMTKGNIQDAMLKLMEPEPQIPKNHPLYTYAYAENDKWATEEIESYQQALIYCDKDFLSIAQEVKTKTVQQCVQFYYLWKKICPEEYKRLRIIRRKREMDSNYNLRSKLYGPDEVTDFEQTHTPKSDDRGLSPGQPGELVGERFVCDHPDCFASFTSRQALNGHIRIHGGNPTLGRIGGHHGKGANDDLNVQPYSPSTNSISNASTHYMEVIEEFPCKICGKVFYKVKSRNAHMKSHRPIDSDRHK